jgi:hypothetical protein
MILTPVFMTETTKNVQFTTSRTDAQQLYWRRGLETLLGFNRVKMVISVSLYRYDPPNSEGLLGPRMRYAAVLVAIKRGFQEAYPNHLPIFTFNMRRCPLDGTPWPRPIRRQISTKHF